MHCKLLNYITRHSFIVHYYCFSRALCTLHKSTISNCGSWMFNALAKIQHEIRHHRSYFVNFDKCGNKIHATPIWAQTTKISIFTIFTILWYIAIVRISVPDCVNIIILHFPIRPRIISHFTFYFHFQTMKWFSTIRVFSVQHFSAFPCLDTK